MFAVDNLLHDDAGPYYFLHVHSFDFTEVGEGHRWEAFDRRAEPRWIARVDGRASFGYGLADNRHVVAWGRLAWGDLL